MGAETTVAHGPADATTHQASVGGRPASARPVTEVLDGPGNGRPCDACGGILAKDQKAVSGIVIEDWRSIQLHADCFQVWDVERVETWE
jgi:hypothetical protein